MKYDPITKTIEWTAEDRTRHKAIREKFKHCPSIEELFASGEIDSPTPHLPLPEVETFLHDLKKVREAKGLSLADVSKRTGIGKAALSRLENGQQLNPTVDTLWRYAGSLGKQLKLSFADIGQSRRSAKSNGRAGQPPAKAAVKKSRKGKQPSASSTQRKGVRAGSVSDG